MEPWKTKKAENESHKLFIEIIIIFFIYTVLMIDVSSISEQRILFIFSFFHDFET